ncbi:MAG TPA: DNA replication protein [Rhodospirillaceae bacterium]|nr:DNA replication protein [Rhodospirillaceae bacterium]
MSQAQLPFDLGHVPTYALDEFLEADGNAEALARVTDWSGWPHPACGLIGPAGCGKTHLAHVFCDLSGGLRLDAGALTTELVPELAEAPAVALEDADRGVDETALFHLYNLMKENRRRLLLTARLAPSRWPVALADLRSRLATVPLAMILPPDDSLIGSVLLKLFSDRQLAVTPDVIAFILTRMERSFDSARALVAGIDAASLAQHRRITVPLVRDLLPHFSQSRET